MALIEHLPPDERGALLHPLLTFLDQDKPAEGMAWHDWQVVPVAGGANNRLYWASHPLGAVAIKFTIRDDLDRAGREFLVLSTLALLDTTIAPHALWLDHSSYSYPVVVQTWMDGPTASTPPADEDEWQRLLEHLATIHSLTPDIAGVALPRAVVDAEHIRAGKPVVMQQAALIPEPEQPASLQMLVRRLEDLSIPTWSNPPRVLCRADPNCTNFIRRPDRWVSVDWEYSGWSDPACELADVMAHPAYRTVPASRWEWFVETYCAIVGDPTVAERVPFYHRVLVVWWAARYARVLYQSSQGVQRKLVEHKPGYAARARAKYEQYLELADRLL